RAARGAVPSRGRGEHPYYSGLSLEWARRWPAEEIWMARKAPLVGAALRGAGFAGAPSAPLTRNVRHVRGVQAVSELSPDAATNRAYWDRLSDEYQRLHADTLRGAAWGTWQIPEAELH